MTRIDEETTSENTPLGRVVVPKNSFVIHVANGNMCSPPVFVDDEYPVEIRHCISGEEYSGVLKQV
jgi:hypothetical protein